MNIATRAACMVALLSILTACSSGNSVEEHIAKANQFIVAAKYDAAIIELKNALQQETDSAEARWLLGKVYLNSGDILSAEKELQRALKLGWPKSDVMPALASSLLAQRKYAQVGELQQITGLEPQAKANLLATKALAAMGLGENKKASKLVNKALDQNPDSTAALLAKARILASQGDLEGADVLLDALFALEPDDAAAWSLLGDIRMAQLRPDEALAAYEKTIALQKNNYSALFKRALLYLQMENYTAAEADAKTLLAVAPQHPGANYVQGLVHFQARRYDEAITSLSVAEPVFRQFPLVLFFLGSAQLVEGNLDQASVQASRFHGIVPESIRGRKLLATIYLQQGKYNDVEELLRPVLDAGADDVGALNLMANALLRDGKTEEGITLLSRVAELQPDSPAAQVRLGAGLLMGGKGDDAAQHMEAALELNPEFQQADILLVLNHLQKQDYEAAIEAAQAYRRRNLTSTTPLNLLGRVYLAASQPEEATESYEKALKFDAGDPTANHNLAQMAAASGDLDAARKYYETILEHHKDNLPALIQLALLDAKQKDEKSLVAHLEQAMQAHPGAIEPRLLLGRYYLTTKEPEKVATLFTGLDEVQKHSPKVLQLMAMAQLASKDSEAARYTLEQLTEAAPENALAHHMMAMAAAGTGDTEQAEQELKRALEIDENYLPSRIALARLVLATGRTEEFGRQLEKLKTLAPDNANVLLLRAVSATRSGDAGAAVKFAEQAYKLAPGTATVLALGSYKEAAGDNSEQALQLYRSWLDKNPKDVPVRMMIADTLQSEQEIGAAAEQYEKILQLAPENVVALNNLAWNIRNEDPKKALGYARQAASLAPDSADVLDTLAVVEYGNKNYRQAERTVERALRHSSDNPSIIYHSAMITAALGDSASAIGTLEELLKGGEDFPEVGEAQELLVALKK